MTITSTIIVRRNRDDVWSFLADLQNRVRVRPLLVAGPPVLHLIGRRALSTDMDFLRRSLDDGLDLTKLATRGS